MVIANNLARLAKANFGGVKEPNKVILEHLGRT